MKKTIIMLLMIFSLGLVSCKKETDAQKVAKAKKDLTITFTEPKDNVNSVTSDIFLRVKQNGVDVSWTTSNLDIVDERGFVTTPLNDTIVLLTATLRLNEISETKSFTVFVKKFQEDIQVDDIKYYLPEEFEDLFADKHVYITTIGQGGELSSLNTILARYVYTAAEEEQYVEKVTMGNMIKANDVPSGSVVIIVPGASGKGLGAAGTNLAQELTRAQNFAAKAAAGDIILIVVHMGGAARRGSETDPLINALVGEAALILVEESGNDDGFFNNLSNPNVFIYPIVKNMADSFKQLFNKLD